MTDFGISAVMNLAYDKNLQEEEESQGERGRTEERPVVWYLVRCFTVRGEWHIINRIYLACMILYTKLTFFLSIDQPGSAGL